MEVCEDMCYERRRAECQYKVCVYYTEIVYTEIYYFALLVTSRHSKTHVPTYKGTK